MALNSREQGPAGWPKIAEQLRRAAPPAALSEIQLARIARRVFDSPLPPRRARRWAALGVAVACAAMIWLARRHDPAPSRPTPTIARTTPPRAIERARTAVLASGQLAVGAGDETLTIAVPDGRVIVRAHALVEIEVSHQHTRIAAYRGEATLETNGFTLTIPAGRRTHQSGAVVAAEDRLAVVEAALDGRGAKTNIPAPPPAGSTPQRRAAHAPAAARDSTEAEAAPAIRPPPPSAAPSLAAESELVGTGLRRLEAQNPAGALLIADEHAMRFPAGRLSGEATLMRATALARLDRRDEALAALGQALARGAGPVNRLTLMRGELRASGGECASAITDFDAVLRSMDPAVVPRARFDRGVCRAKLGDRDGARSDLQQFLEGRPVGPNAAAARRALEE